MKKFAKILTYLVFALPMMRARAQDCSALITLDEAGVFGDARAVDRGAQTLIDQGADVHVVSVRNVPVNGLVGTQKWLEDRCPSWMADGHRKPNLFVVMVAPSAHKKNAFFGAAYSPVFSTEDKVNTIYSQAANAFFKQADFAMGTSVALKDFGGAVVAYHDQQKHLVVSTVTEQATDLHGLWVVMGWVVGLLALGGVVWALVVFWAGRGRRHDELKLAQVNATMARDRATKAYQAMGAGMDTERRAAISARFAELSNSVSNDPTVNDLSKLDYERITAVWRNLKDDIAGVTTRQPRASDPGAGHGSGVISYKPNNVRTKPEWRGSYPRTPTPPPQPTVVVQPSSTNDFLTGMLAEDAIHSSHSHRDDYEPPSRSRSEDSGSDSSYSSSSGYDSGSSSGSDSSWSSSDSSSSSDFGGGGSDSSW